MKNLFQASQGPAARHGVDAALPRRLPRAPTTSSSRSALAWRWASPRSPGTSSTEQPVEALQWLSARDHPRPRARRPSSLTIRCSSCWKPSIIYVVVGAGDAEARLDEPLPRRRSRRRRCPTSASRFGYVWAGLMFFSAVLNIVLALTSTLTTWAVVSRSGRSAARSACSVSSTPIMKSTGIRRRGRHDGG